MKKLKNGGNSNNEEQKSANENANGVSNISVLPAAILLEIFFKFPIAVIMNCKLVCKTWYKLLSEPTFTANYSRNSPFTHFIFPMDPSTQSLSLLEISNNGNCIQTPINLNLPDWLEKESWFDFVDSFNGFLCIRICKPGTEIVYICNPILGEYISLPEHEDYDDKRLPIYQFGFIPSTNTFKVLRITYKSMICEVDKCSIFTVGVDDRWRSLTIPVKTEIFWPCGVSVKGAVHFIHQIGNEGPFLIRTFDFEEEKIGQIPHPRDVVMDDGNMDFIIFNNQLGFVDYSVRSQLTIWRMKEYGNVESWSENVIQMRCLPAGMRSRRKLSPVGELQSGDILLATTRLVSYDVEKKKCSKIKLNDIGRGILDMKAYAPNFSSLNEVKMDGQ